MCESLYKPVRNYRKLAYSGRASHNAGCSGMARHRLIRCKARFDVFAVGIGYSLSHTKLNIRSHNPSASVWCAPASKANICLVRFGGVQGSCTRTANTPPVEPFRLTTDGIQTARLSSIRHTKRAFVRTADALKTTRHT